MDAWSAVSSDEPDTGWLPDLTGMSLAELLASDNPALNAAIEVIRAQLAEPVDGWGC